MRKIVLCFTFLLPTLSTSVSADILGLSAKLGLWLPDFDGTVTKSNVDVDDELGLDSDNSLYISASFEHPVPLLPNLKVAHTRIEDSGNGTINRSFEFGGQTFDANSPVSSEVDANHTDITLYYEFIDIGFDLDLGVTARKYDGDLTINSDTVRAREDIDYWIPMGYLAARIDLPFLNFYVAGDINGVGYRDSKLIDYSVMGGWQTSVFPAIDLGLEIGYRSMSLDLDEDDVGDFDSDVDIEGFFGNLVANF